MTPTPRFVGVREPPQRPHRQLREQREGPVRRRRRVQPLLLLTWIAGTIALLVVAVVLGFNFFFAPRVMAWVEDNPGAIEHGVVQDFVRWYDPDALSDEPASDQQQRVTVTIEQGSTDASIGQLLFDQGLIRSQVAFQYAVITAGREGTLNFGTYDLSPTLRPSQIVAALQGVEFGPTTAITIQEGLRLEEVVATFAASEMTMNTQEFASILQAPPADLLNQYDFLADLPVGRSLEGYIPPDTYEFEISGEHSTPIEVARRLLGEFQDNLTDEIIAGLQARNLTLDQAIIIASIVEREAVIDEERPQIAAVYINRLQNPDNGQTNGLLNADPTLQYGLTTGELRPVGHPFLADTEGSTLPSTSRATRNGGRSSRSPAARSRSRSRSSDSRPTPSRVCRQCRSPRRGSTRSRPWRARRSTRATSTSWRAALAAHVMDRTTSPAPSMSTTRTSPAPTRSAPDNDRRRWHPAHRGCDMSWMSALSTRSSSRATPTSAG